MVVKILFTILGFILAFVAQFFLAIGKSAETVAASISASVACFSFILALITIVMAYEEYKKKSKFEQCEVIMRYNERYENSGHINRVVFFLIQKCQGKEVASDDFPSIYDKEMFLRFFEELNYMIDCGYLEKEIVADTFAFYFLVAWNDDKYFWDSEMREPSGSMKDAQKSPLWRNARSFYKKMKCYETEDVEEFLKQLKTK